MKIVIAILTFALLSHVVSAQNSFQNLVNVSTVSPDVASLGKFGNVPVSYSTGVPAITIPIYEINIGKIKLPVSFDYHAGGIRVDEISSSVGLGWALNGVGAISRNMVGQPDESPAGYLNSPDFDSLYNWQTGADYGTGIANKYSQYLIYLSMYHENETEPDVFSYSLNGQSGKFIFKKDGSIMQIPRTNNRIIKNGNDFTIIDENGVQYIFDKKERTSYVGASASPDYFSTWRLSMIIDQNGTDTISFKYETACDVNVSHYENFGYTLGYGANCEGSDAVSYFGPTYSRSTVYHNDQLYPNEISWRGGKITLSYTCGRQDKASEKRLDEVSVYSNQNDQLKLVKKIKLYQSYFFSDPIPYGTVDEKNYRLRLDSVGFMSTLDAQKYCYRMTYNSSQPMAPRESYAQDKWGFNNGQVGNSSLMPTQTVLYNGAYYTIGAANREPDAAAMQACNINSIEYPTRGKTVFEFEPHQYNSHIDYTENKAVHCDAYGGVQQTNTATFTAAENTTGYSFNIYISSYNYPNVTDRPRVRITDLTTSQQILFASNSDAYHSYSSGTLVLNVITGHTYSIVTDIYTTNSNVIATATVSWVQTYTNVPVQPIGGGLRVKTVTNYDINGEFVNKDIYKYGVGEDGIGKLLTEANYLLVNYENVRWRCGNNYNSSSCYYVDSYGADGTIYHANSVYPASQFGGSPVLYSSVTKYQVNASGNAINGKSDFGYEIFEDGPGYASSDYGRVGVLLIQNEWKNGFPGWQHDYKYNSVTNGYDLIHSKRNIYQVQRADTMMGLKVTTRILFTGGCYTSSDIPWAKNGFTLIRLPVYSGAMLLQSTSDTTWDDNNNQLVTGKNYYYNDDRHTFVTSSQEYNSKGEILTDNFQYPYDFSSSGNVYQGMIDRNIVSPVVSEQKLLSGVQQSLTTIHYTDWFGNTKLLQPQNVDVQVKSSPVETKVRFNRFDEYGNILQQQKENDIFQTFIWDYQSVYPVAQCSNADYNSIAYTSFEADGTGNWDIGSVTRATNGVTGGKSYSLLNGAIQKSGLNTAAVYLVSYWSNGGSYSVTGNTGSIVQGRTITVNGVRWTYYQHQVTGQATVTITGNGGIDELRLHPKEAKMSTFTYEPLTGMTSKCDERGYITYFEYDGFGRVSLIRDENANILRKFCYSYVGQQSSCDLAGNAAKTKIFTKSGCDGTAGLIGTSVTYTVPANTYFGPNADVLAQNDLDANGQANADKNGSCVVVYHNVVKSRTFTKDNCTLNGAPSSVTYTVPAGMYAASSQQAADQLAQNDLDAKGQAYADSIGYCTWYNDRLVTSYQKNCTPGGSGSVVNYIVPQGAYSSTISASDANNKATNDANANGQNYANANGVCFWNSGEMSINFQKNDCGSGSSGTQVTYVVPANRYSSTISQEDADAQAEEDLYDNGQEYANENGSCELNTINVLYTNSGERDVDVWFYNNTTDEGFYFNIRPYASDVPLAITPGTYDIIFWPDDSGRNSHSFSAGCNYWANGYNVITIYGVPFTADQYGSCNTVYSD
ncbi:hypothetical protein A4D02_26500 [Niastella koreensis]|uniref:DUF5977 domain-containing protein n=2 Tax=Niastella koreensis TaxID=354356 RepID=G8TDF0_NIAKG|nr:DUF5977 domain-containing protein [Niastella koreensis]AEV99390.1 hypothetical protein Niako_3060 [Niastella koreensis GR20-10]OQP49994.1 hypothetical protein A4D02_26500 [Niastella koreensis]